MTRKLLSLLVAIVMVMTAIPFAMAEDAPMKITVAGYMFGPIDDTKDVITPAVEKMLLEKHGINVDIVVEYIEYSDYSDILAPRLVPDADGNNNAPDVFLALNKLDTYYDQGVIASWDIDFFKENAPDVWNFIESGCVNGELASQLRQADTSVGAVRTLGEQQQNALNRLQGEIGALESKIADANSQTRALADLFQRNASTADERTLVQVEQAVTLAIQQLQLANNAEAALAALAVADEELSTGTQAYFQELRRALAQDMAALRDARRLDVSGLAMRIENVLKKIDALPLAYEFTPKDTLAAPQQAPAAPADEDGWLDRMRLGAQQLADEVWRDVSSMVRIERTNGAVSPALLSPEQGTYLRENVKVRLLTARLALFMRDVGSFQTDLQQARAHLERYFDTRQEAVQSAVADLGALLEQPMQESLPTLDNTLAALRQAQVRLENASRLGAPASEQH